ncbi:MAG: hypothetical protein QOI83_2086, partial [Streptomycetaceae bacterium]|nr:hypothetical protein [Streptomycetaceae bacterium]
SFVMPLTHPCALKIHLGYLDGRQPERRGTNQ